MSAAEVLLCLLLTAPARAGGYDDIASDLTSAATRHHKTRVAVIPFQMLPARESAAGLIVAERLTGRLLRRGKLDVVERTLLESVMSEQRLDASGLVDPGTVRELGRILGVDAVIAGTLILLSNGRIEINSRMIDAQTAQVLAAGSAEVAKDWSESMLDGGWSVPAPRLPEFDAAWPAAGKLNDGLNAGLHCAQARAALAERDKELVDAKARFWARRLCEPGFSAVGLTRNPGSEIRDTELRHEFYARLKRWSGCSPAPDLTGRESQELSEHERRARILSETCREGVGL